ncbi:hypothetical protein C0W44_09750 [Photobacterium leiognathi subsp. mandapamensis]|nr:hypothetical protein C0W44_09750 [Photobacterium leiognathi subsp. mandapamensis]
MKFIVPFLFAYLGSKLIFSFFNFSYNFISDSFDLTNLLIDIGVFAVLWVLAELSYKKFTERSRMTNS